jgi:hypothetical protein
MMNVIYKEVIDKHTNQLGAAKSFDFPVSLLSDHKQCRSAHILHAAPLLQISSHTQQYRNHNDEERLAHSRVPRHVLIAVPSKR